MLAKPAGDDLRPLGQGPPPTAHLLPGRQGAVVEPEDKEAAEQLQADPLSNLPEQAPSRPGATGAAPLERVSPLGDIVLDAALLHIPSMAEPELDVRGVYALPGQHTLACRHCCQLLVATFPVWHFAPLGLAAIRPCNRERSSACRQQARARQDPCRFIRRAERRPIDHRLVGFVRAGGGHPQAAAELWAGHWCRLPVGQGVGSPGAVQRHPLAQ